MRKVLKYLYNIYYLKTQFYNIAHHFTTSLPWKLLFFLTLNYIFFFFIIYYFSSLFLWLSLLCVSLSQSSAAGHYIHPPISQSPHSPTIAATTKKKKKEKKKPTHPKPQDQRIIQVKESQKSQQWPKTTLINPYL